MFFVQLRIAGLASENEGLTWESEILMAPAICQTQCSRYGFPILMKLGRPSWAFERSSSEYPISSWDDDMYSQRIIRQRPVNGIRQQKYRRRAKCYPRLN
jgi:hypothetical protein